MIPLAAGLAPSDATRALIWSLALIVILVAAFAVVAKVKQRLRHDLRDGAGSATGFTLSDLRKMHRDGLLTDEELAKAKERIVAAAHQRADRQRPEPLPEDLE